MNATGSAADARVDYGRLEPVDPDKLRGLGVDRDYCARFALGRNSVAITIVEMFRASHHYPVAFTRDQERVTPCAVLGLAEGQNLFVDPAGGWCDGVYAPAFLRRFPFITAAVDPGAEKHGEVVLVDPAALSRDAAPLFDRDGVATEAWRSTEKFIADYLSAERATFDFTDRLVECDLLEAFDARVFPAAAEPIRIAGLLRVDENRLNALPAKKLRGFMNRGQLSRIYAHLISLDNFAKLLDLSRLSGGQ